MEGVRHRVVDVLCLAAVPMRHAVCQGVFSAATLLPGGSSDQSRTAKS